jgi:conjugative transfer signal peptidase TraF
MMTSMRFVLAILFAVSAAAAAMAAPSMAPVVIYNGSPSAPVGFYFRAPVPRGETVRRGAFVTIASVKVARDYARLRHFAGSRNWFIKRVAATEGARICAQGDVVSIDARNVKRLARDREGRTLPTWTGCRQLARDEVFLLGDTPDSFDSRYWGPVRVDDLDGVWTRLWPRDDAR